MAFKTLNDILFRFRADTKSLESGTKRASRSMSNADRATKTLTKAMGALGLAVGAREFVQFGQDSIKAASDYNESVNAVETATGRAAGAIIAFGEDGAAAVGLSKTAINEAAVAFAGFGKKIDTDGDISDTFIDYTQRAADFAAMMNLTVPEALDVFASTLAGQSRPIRTFGIDTSAAAVSAFSIAEGLTEAGDVMSADAKVLATYGLLMQETAGFAGTFAQEADDLGGAQRILNAEWSNAKIALGQELIPAALDFTQVSSDLIPVLAVVIEKIFAVGADAARIVKPVLKAAQALGIMADAGKGVGKETKKVDEFKGVFTDNAFGVMLSGLGAAADIMDVLRGKTKLTWSAAEEGPRIIDNVALSMFELERETAGAAAATGDLTDEQKTLQEVMQDGFSPVAAAIKSYQSFERVLEEVDKDGERSAEELFDLALAALDVDAKFSALSVDDIDAALAALSYELGISKSAARKLLRELGYLDGKTVRVKINVGITGSGGKYISPGGKIGLRAKGGPVSAGDPYVVGEEGPELMVPNQSGTIIPNGATTGARGVSVGSGSNVYNINVTAIDPDSAAVAVVDAIRSYEDRFGAI
jgi:hypothetical protein